MENDNKNKIVLIIARLLCICFILFACNNTKDAEPFKLPELRVPEIAIETVDEKINEDVIEGVKEETKEEVKEDIKEETKEEVKVEAKEEVKATESLATKEKSKSEIIKEDIVVATRSKIDKIVFAGDIYFSSKVKNAYDTNGTKAIIDDYYKELIETSDISVGNLECAITDGTAEEVDKEYNLFTPEKYLDVLKEIGFDVFSLANNHVIDYGKNILVETLDKLKAHKISYVGAGKNLAEAKKFYSKTIDGKKYAIFSASAVIPSESWKASEKEPGVNNGYDIAEVCKDIRNIRKDYDKIIVYMHWGEELSEHSNSSQQALAHKLVDFGADLVVGSHPHVVQEIEYYKNTPIVYSLGNFIYGATKRETMLLEANFDYSVVPEGILIIRIYPGLSNYEKVKMYWQEEDLATMCKKMQDRCNTCYVANNGYIFTKEAVEMALRRLASESEIEKIEE